MGFTDKFRKKESQIQSANRYGCFDKIDYQYDKALSNYLFLMKKKEEELSEEDIKEIQRYAGNHIGFFITWIIKNGFVSEFHKGDEDALESVKNEVMLGVDFLIQYCDGKFWGQDISDNIFPFVNSYYGQYMFEYSSWVINELGDLPLEFTGTWEDYHKFKHVLDEAYKQYNMNNKK